MHDASRYQPLSNGMDARWVEVGLLLRWRGVSGIDRVVSVADHTVISMSQSEGTVRVV